MGAIDVSEVVSGDGGEYVGEEGDILRPVPQHWPGPAVLASCSSTLSLCKL